MRTRVFDGHPHEIAVRLPEERLVGRKLEPCAIRVRQSLQLGPSNSHVEGVKSAIACGNTVASCADSGTWWRGFSRELIEIDVPGENRRSCSKRKATRPIPAIDVRLFRRQHIEDGLAFA